jgi:hypothetical protein
MNNTDDVVLAGEATSHRIKSNIRFLHRILPGWITYYLGNVPWPTCSPELLASYHILSDYRYFNKKSYNIQPCTTDNLERYFHDEFIAIQEQILHKIITP